MVSRFESQTDSVRIEYRDIVREIIKDTTVYVEVAYEKVMEIARDSSHLETLFAKSDAWVDQEGLLRHMLENKPQRIEKEVQVVNTKTIRDSIIYVYRDREVEVVKKDNGYKIGLGIMFICLILISGPLLIKYLIRKRL